MTTFLHTADWQLGKHFHRVRNPDKQARLRQERIACIGRIGAVAGETGCSFILVAGDLFDSPTPTRETVAAALESIGALALPVIVIPGNHDPGGPDGFWEQPFFTGLREKLAPNLVVLLEPRPHALPDAWILPCPLLRRIGCADPTAWIREPGVLAGCDDGRPVIVLAHGSTQAFGAGERYDDEEGETGAAEIIELDRLPPGAADYCALGDWHGTKRIRPWAWYSGTPEQDRFSKGGDHDPGNVLVVKVGRGVPPEVTVRRTSRLAWHADAFLFGGVGSVERFEERIEELLAGAGGDSLLQLDLGGALDLAASERLRAYLAALDARVLRLKLRDGTSVVPSQEEIAELTESGAHPLIASVASALCEEAAGAGAGAEVARAALEILFPLARPR